MNSIKAMQLDDSLGKSQCEKLAKLRAERNDEVAKDRWKIFDLQHEANKIYFR